MTQRIEIDSITRDVLYCWGTVRHNTSDPDVQDLAMSMLYSVLPGRFARQVECQDTERWNHGIEELLARARTTELRATSLSEAIWRAKFEQTVTKSLLEE